MAEGGGEVLGGVVVAGLAGGRQVEFVDRGLPVVRGIDRMAAVAVTAHRFVAVGCPGLWPGSRQWCCRGSRPGRCRRHPPRRHTPPSGRHRRGSERSGWGYPIGKRRSGSRRWPGRRGQVEAGRGVGVAGLVGIAMNGAFPLFVLHGIFRRPSLPGLHRRWACMPSFPPWSRRLVQAGASNRSVHFASLHSLYSSC